MKSTLKKLWKKHGWLVIIAVIFLAFSNFQSSTLTGGPILARIADEDVDAGPVMMSVDTGRDYSHFKQTQSEADLRAAHAGFLDLQSAIGQSRQCAEQFTRERVVYADSSGRIVGDCGAYGIVQFYTQPSWGYIVEKDTRADGTFGYTGFAAGTQYGYQCYPCQIIDTCSSSDAGKKYCMTEYQYRNCLSNGVLSTTLNNCPSGQKCQLTSTSSSLVGECKTVSTSCQEQWSCGDWKSYSGTTWMYSCGQRVCTDSNHCGSTSSRPAITKLCSSLPLGSSCAQNSECSSGSCSGNQCVVSITSTTSGSGVTRVSESCSLGTDGTYTCNIQLKNTGTTTIASYLVEMQVRPKGSGVMAVVSPTGSATYTCDSRYKENVHKRITDWRSGEPVAFSMAVSPALTNLVFTGLGDYDVYLISATQCGGDLVAPYSTSSAPGIKIGSFTGLGSSTGSSGGPNGLGCGELCQTGTSSMNDDSGPSTQCLSGWCTDIPGTLRDRCEPLNFGFNAYNGLTFSQKNDVESGQVCASAYWSGGTTGGTTTTTTGTVSVGMEGEPVCSLQGDVANGFRYSCTIKLKNTGTTTMASYLVEMQVRPKGSGVMAVVSPTGSAVFACDSNYPENVNKRITDWKSGEIVEFNIESKSASTNKVFKGVGDYDVYLISATKCGGDLIAPYSNNAASGTKIASFTASASGSTVSPDNIVGDSTGDSTGTKSCTEICSLPGDDLYDDDDDSKISTECETGLWCTDFPGSLRSRCEPIGFDAFAYKSLSFTNENNVEGGSICASEVWSASGGATTGGTTTGGTTGGVISESADCSLSGKTISCTVKLKNTGTTEISSFLLEMQVRPKGSGVMAVITPSGDESNLCDSRYKENVHKTITGWKSGENVELSLYAAMASTNLVFKETGDYDVYLISATQCGGNLIAPYSNNAASGTKIKTVTVSSQASSGKECGQDCTPVNREGNDDSGPSTECATGWCADLPLTWSDRCEPDGFDQDVFNSELTDTEKASVKSGVCAKEYWSNTIVCANTCVEGKERITEDCTCVPISCTKVCGEQEKLTEDCTCVAKCTETCAQDETQDAECNCISNECGKACGIWTKCTDENLYCFDPGNWEYGGFCQPKTFTQKTFDNLEAEQQEQIANGICSTEFTSDGGEDQGDEGEEGVCTDVQAGKIGIQKIGYGLGVKTLPCPTMSCVPEIYVSKGTAGISVGDAEIIYKVCDSRGRCGSSQTLKIPSGVLCSMWDDWGDLSSCTKSTTLPAISEDETITVADINMFHLDNPMNIFITSDDPKWAYKFSCFDGCEKNSDCGDGEVCSDGVCEEAKGFIESVADLFKTSPENVKLGLYIVAGFFAFLLIMPMLSNMFKSFGGGGGY